jgi:hypothetical protein
MSSRVERTPGTSYDFRTVVGIVGIVTSGNAFATGGVLLTFCALGFGVGVASNGA